MDEFYNLVDTTPSIFGDHIFEMCDVDTSEGLDFSEFVTAIMTYCFFGKNDILKFCFYIFDKDKNGFIEDDELQDLVAILHKDGMTSNIESTLSNLDTDKDGRLYVCLFFLYT